LHQLKSNPRRWLICERIITQLRCLSMNNRISNIGYRIKVFSDIWYNVGLRSLQSDFGGSNIRLSPISLIMHDIGLSAHLGPYCTPHIQTVKHHLEDELLSWRWNTFSLGPYCSTPHIQTVKHHLEDELLSWRWNTFSLQDRECLKGEVGWIFPMRSVFWTVKFSPKV
jgi:hypothetical protein